MEFKIDEAGRVDRLEKVSPSEVGPDAASPGCVAAPDAPPVRLPFPSEY